LEARNGYFADTYSADPADDARREIEEAFFSSKEVNDVPICLRTKFFKDGDAATLTVATNVDASKLTFRKEARQKKSWVDSGSGSLLGE
jgi:hypothetical protein